MLNAFRQHLKDQSWPKWLLIVVAASMTLYLGAYFLEDTGPAEATSEWAAKVGDATISAARFRAAARRLDQSYREMLGENYSQYRQQFRIGSQAVQQVLEQELILRDARRLGLTVSNRELIEHIRTMPELADASGKFIGKKEYERRVSNFYRGQGGVAAFEKELSESLLLDKWTDVMSQAVSIDDRQVEELHRERTEKTTLDFFVVRLSDHPVDTRVDDAQARAWYEAHLERYAHGPGRKVRYVVVERQAEVERVQVGAEEARAHYENNRERYSHPEQRRARHILFRLDPGADETAREAARAQARKALERVRSGADFAVLARELSQDKLSAERGGDLGWFGRGQMVGPFEDAVFATPPGQLAPLTESEFGVHVIRVDEAREAGLRPFEEVREEIERELRFRAADERIVSEAARLREKIATPDRLAAAAADAGLTMEQRLVTSREDLRDLGLAPDSIDPLLELAAGQVSQPVRGARGLYIVVVDELVPAGARPLEEVAARVRADVVDQRTRDATLAAARGALAHHGGLAAAARALGAKVEPAKDLAPGQALPGAGGDSAALRTAIFGDGVHVGSRGVAPVPAGAVVFEVTGRVPFDAAAFSAAKPGLREELRQQRRNSLVRSLVDMLRRQQEIVINEELVQQLDGRS